MLQAPYGVVRGERRVLRWRMPEWQVLQQQRPAVLNGCRVLPGVHLLRGDLLRAGWLVVQRQRVLRCVRVRSMLQQKHGAL